MKFGNYNIAAGKPLPLTIVSFILLNRALKAQIMFECKAPKLFKSGAYTKYVSILKRFATPPSDIRWAFKARF